MSLSHEAEEELKGEIEIHPISLRRESSLMSWQQSFPKPIMVKIYMYVFSYDFSREFFIDQQTGWSAYKSIVSYRLICRRWNETVCQAFEFLTSKNFFKDLPHVSPTHKEVVSLRNRLAQII